MLYYINSKAVELIMLYYINKEILVFGETKAVFLEDYFGFHHHQLALAAGVLIATFLVFASLFAYFIGRLNFLHR